MSPTALANREAVILKKCGPPGGSQKALRPVGCWGTRKHPEPVLGLSAGGLSTACEAMSEPETAEQY